MMRVPFSIFGVILSASGAMAQGPSFDCAKASTPVEVAICSSTHLSRLDREMAKVYASLRNELGVQARQDLLDRQRAWLADRDNCRGSETCLARKMSDRIDALKTRASFPSEQSGGMPPSLIGQWFPHSDMSSPDGVRLSSGVADFGRNGRYEIEQVRPGGWVFRITDRNQDAMQLMCGYDHATYVAFMPARMPHVSSGTLLEYQFTAQDAPLPEPDPSNPMDLLTGACSMAYYVRN